MQESTIPRRWARALISLLDEAEKGRPEILTKVEAELSALAANLGKGSDLRNVMFNPSFSNAQRVQVLMGIADAGQFHVVTRQFLGLLVEKDRVRYVEGIASMFRAEVDERLNRVRATITAAKPLEAQALAELTSALKLRVGKDVVTEVIIEPSVLSGVKAQIGGVVYDGTVRSQIDRLRASLA